MKKYIGFFIFLLNSNLISAQAQNELSLQQQFTRFDSDMLREKLFVHTDKTFYLAGETIWCKVYTVNISPNKQTGSSRISYIEILSKEGKPVVQTKIGLVKGKGNGSIVLPGSLNSGSYILRAYTSWMKNFPPEFYFEQPLSIVNTFKTPVRVPVSNLSATIQFFPEGGTMVKGISGKMAFKATDGYGHGLDCKGIIVNQQNDTIIHFQSIHNGMGNFQFRPEKNDSYYALLRLHDSMIKQKIPDPEEHGFVMQVTAIEGGNLSVIVRASPDLNNSSVYLIAQTRKLVKNVQTKQVRDGEVQFQVDRSDLGDGISSIILFDQSRQPVCERLVFKRPAEKIFMEAKSDQAVYGNRKPVLIDLTSGNKDKVPLPGDFSLSVFMVDSLQPVPDQSIVSWFYLGSELKGKIESPEYYLSQTDNTADEALDNLLLTNGWRRFKSNDASENKKTYFEFLPEIEGPVVNGKIINKLTGATVSHSVAFVSVPGADYAFNSATSDAQGLIHFGFRDIYRNNTLVVQPALAKDSNYRIDISNAWSEKFNNSVFPDISISKNQENLLVNRSISNQVENTYNINKKRRYVPENLDTTSFYGLPDRIFNLEEFTRFQTMEEVLREYVDDVRVRKDGDHFTFKVRNKLFGTYFDEDPLILLDGIPVTDVTKILTLDPQMIKRIEVVTHNYYVGSSAFAGIVNVKSYGGELGVRQIDPNALVVEFEGLQQQRIFYSPQYNSAETEQSHIPDFRNVLFWDPEVITDTNGKSRLKFYTSDLKGKFAVVVQGLTAEGLPGKQ